MASGSLGELYTTIGVKTDGLQAGTRRAESILRQSAAKMDQHAKRIQAALDIKTDRFTKRLSQNKAYVERYASAMRDIQSRISAGGAIGAQAKGERARLRQLASALPDGVIRRRVERAIAQGARDGSRKMNKHMSSAASKVVRKLRSMFIMIGGVYLLQRLARGAIRLFKHLMDITGQFERLRVTLDTITHGRGMDTFNALNQWAIKMPINTMDAIRGFVQLRSQGIRPTIGDLEVLVDTASALSIGGKGGVGELYRSIGNYLARMKATSRVTMEEIRLLGERGVPAAQILQREFGLTVKQMRRLGHESLNVDRTIAALLRGMEQRFGGQAAKMMETYTGMIEILKASWQEWVRVMMNTGPFQAVKSQMQALIKWLDSEAGKQRLAKWAQDVGVALLNTIKIMSTMFPAFLIGFAKIVQRLIAVVNKVAGVLNLKGPTEVDDVKYKLGSGFRDAANLPGMTQGIQEFVHTGNRAKMGQFSESDWANVEITGRTKGLIKAREEFEKEWADWERVKRVKGLDAGPAPERDFSKWLEGKDFPFLKGLEQHGKDFADYVDALIADSDKIPDVKGKIRELIPLEIGTGMETMMAEVATETDNLTTSLARLSMSGTAFKNWELNRELASVRKNLTGAMMAVDSAFKNEEGAFSGVSDETIASYEELDEKIRVAHRTGDVEKYRRLQLEMYALIQKIVAEHKASFLGELVDAKDDRLPDEYKSKLQGLIAARADEEQIVASLNGLYTELNDAYKKAQERGSGSEVLKDLKGQRDKVGALSSDYEHLGQQIKTVGELMKEQAQGFEDADAYENLKRAQIALEGLAESSGLLGEILQLGGMDDAAKRLEIETRAAQMRAAAGGDGEMLEMVEAWRQAALAGVGDVKKAAGQVTFFSDASSRWQSIQRAISEAGQKKREGNDLGEGFRQKVEPIFKNHVNSLQDLFRSGIETKPLWGY